MKTEKQKKILFLGGSAAQLPAIKFAKDIGLYVITLDYLPDNPGHKISDKYYNISTRDKETVLSIAERMKIDAISSYASDPSAITAAYVSDKLGLIGGGMNAVTTLSHKGLFRTFLSKNGFNIPWFKVGKRLIDFDYSNYKGKSVLKPVDSSGSKGVFFINNELELIKAFSQSIKHSILKELILESYIDRYGPQIHGEAYIKSGKIKFICLGDQYFSKTSKTVPFSTIVPSIVHNEIIEKIHIEIQSLITKLGFNTGGINIEIIRDVNDKIFLLEIGARNGGNFMPQLVTKATGFNLVDANLRGLLNEEFSINRKIEPNHYFAQLILHSNHNGKFQKIDVPAIFRKRILNKFLYYKKGEPVNVYKSSKDVIGVLILDITGITEEYINSLSNHPWVVVEKND